MTDRPESVSLYQFLQRFPNEEAARKSFECSRWADEVACPHCGSVSVAEVKNQKPMPYRCRDCRQHFSVRTGTALAESRLPLHKWLMAIYMMTTARKGIPSTQMARELGITQKSAWFLAQRIRKTWLASKSEDMGDHVQVDEIYVGGSEKNKLSSKKLSAAPGTVGKIAVIGMRGKNGIIKASPMADATGETLKAFVGGDAKPGSVVVTDRNASYVGPDGESYRHFRVSRSVGEYGREVPYTKVIQSFLTLLKGGHYGILRYIREKHLHRYVNDFAFRQNITQTGTMGFIEQTIGSMMGKRLTHTGLIYA